MTKDQEHLVTLLFIKHGGFENVVDMWLHSDEILTSEESEAIDEWMISEVPKPLDIKLQHVDGLPYLEVNLDITPLEKD